MINDLKEFLSMVKKKHPAYSIEHSIHADGQVSFKSAGTIHMWNGWCIAHEIFKRAERVNKLSIDPAASYVGVPPSKELKITLTEEFDMYITPQPYKCLKCAHEFQFSIHDHHTAPITVAEEPVCPKCWDAFLHTIGIGYCTVKFNKDGSAYEQALAKKDAQHGPI